MGAGLTLLLAADVAWLLLGNKSGSSEPHPKPSVTQQVMPRQDTEYLESKLNSPSRKEQMQAFIAELRSSPPTQRILPVGVTVKLRAETFRSSNGFGSVAAVVSDQESYIVHVAWEGDKWLIIYTEEVRGS